MDHFNIQKNAPTLSQVVYQMPICKEVYDSSEADSPRRWIATAPISKGCLILLEHAIAGSALSIREVIRHDEGTYDKLWPRSADKQWMTYFKHNEMDAMGEALNQKLSANLMGSPDDKIRTLGIACSGINHAFPSNCAMRTIITEIGRPQESDVLPVAFCYVVAKRDIAKHEEITVTYATEAPKDHPFILVPPKDEIQREIELENEVMRDNTLWTGLVKRYMEQKKWIGTSCRHKLMLDGMFIVVSTAGNCMIMTVKCRGRYNAEQRQQLIDMYTERKKQLTGEAVDMKEIGEPGSSRRNNIENEAIFQWEWESTLQGLCGFDFMRE